MAEPPDELHHRRRSDSEDSEVRTAVRRLVKTLEAMAHTMDQQAPLIAKFEAHLDEEDRSKAAREARALVVEQNHAFMVAAIKELQLRNAQEDHRANVTRARNKVIARAVGGGSGFAAGSLFLGYSTGAGGRLASTPTLFVLGGIAFLCAMALLCLVVSRDVPQLPAGAAAPILETPPKAGL